MLKRLWRWLNKFFQRLFGNKQTPPLREHRKVEPPKQLTDAEYESLFLQLLAEVNDGLSRGGAKDFLAANRINEAKLVEWLGGFGERLLASATPNDELARRMVRLGELNIGEVSVVAYNIGRRLGGGETNRRGADDAEDTKGREKKGIKQVDVVSESTTDKAEAWFNQGDVLYSLGLYEQAIALFEKAIEIKHEYHEAWHNRGVALRQLGEYEEANASFKTAFNQQASKFQPENHVAWCSYGDMLLSLRQYEEAIASYDNAIEFKPEDHNAWYQRGMALYNLGRFEEAIASYDNALKFKPDYHDAWYQRGNALAKLEQGEEAITSWDNALKIQPDDHDAWYQRGYALAELEQYEEAITSHDSAIKIKPEDHEAWHNRGYALVNLGRFEEAIASYDNALKIRPDYYEAWYNWGLTLSNLGRYEEAIAFYDNALKIKPDYHEAWYNWGLTLSNLGRYEEAIAFYDNALKIKPDYHEAWFGRGIVLGYLSRYEEAIASYDNALKIKSDFYKAWINRGDATGNVSGERTDFFFTFTLPSVATSSLALILSNPNLNLYGYEGELASYEEGLKHCHQDTHAEGWGLLHQYIGKTHYFRGRQDSHARYYWHKAVTSYKTALQTLTAIDFPELHLEVLQDLIRVQLDLGETAETKELQRQGTDLLQRLLNEPNRSDQSKKQLALKFAWIQQLTVDLAVQSGDLLQAIELAEEGKNTCLRWLLDGWSDESSSLSYSEMQQLLNPSTAIVYWHLSSYALHTFILKHNASSPIVPRETEFLTQARRLQDFEGWVKNWNQQYSDYRKGKNQQGDKAITWRDNLPEMLRNLSNILDINAVISEIPEITQLILVPHRDLHRFPLHALFPPEFTITYLPSAKIGLIPRTPLEKQDYHLQQLLSIEHPNSKDYPLLEFAQIESEAISQLFPNATRKRSEKATKAELINALPQNYNIFHFTGHGEYNFQNPALSHLALAGEDKLTLADIRNLNLQSYQLVTLAACETAITGNHTITTEYVGLVSGFLGCGVAHVVSTLWTVESAASALVMMQFYQFLQQGKSEAVALAKATQWLRNVTNAELAEWYAAQIAKLPQNEGIIRPFLQDQLNDISIRQTTDQPYNHHYHWAAFTIIGAF
ncbi:MAG: tetratricopeptide repeat protein [Nostoc sp.]|uniref:CHAT domain-containing protein n=1 Tax=Nostoc sp. TaxID=1180 RepID=UPI002FFD4D7E